MPALAIGGSGYSIRGYSSKSLLMADKRNIIVNSNSVRTVLQNHEAVSEQQVKEVTDDPVEQRGGWPQAKGCHARGDIKIIRSREKLSAGSRAGTLEQAI